MIVKVDFMCVSESYIMQKVKDKDVKCKSKDRCHAMKTIT